MRATHRNARNAVKAILRWIFMFINIYVKKEDKSTISFYNLKYKEQTKLNLSEKGNNKKYYIGKERKTIEKKQWNQNFVLQKDQTNKKKIDKPLARLTKKKEDKNNWN